MPENSEPTQPADYARDADARAAYVNELAPGKLHAPADFAEIARELGPEATRGLVEGLRDHLDAGNPPRGGCWIYRRGINPVNNGAGTRLTSGGQDFAVIAVSYGFAEVRPASWRDRLQWYMPRIWHAGRRLARWAGW